MVEVMLGVFFGHLLFSIVVGVARTILFRTQNKAEQR